MMNDCRELILKHNDPKEGIYILYDIDFYIEKIQKNAVIQTYYDENQLKGFIAYYANDLLKNAYLTMILIDKVDQGKKLGKLLLECSIQDLKNRGFITYSLEVLKINQRAISFYTKYGFEIAENRGDLWLMKLNLIDN